MKWYEKSDVFDGVIVSSRVRLARNFSEFPFPNRCQETQAQLIIEKSQKALEQVSQVNTGQQYDFILMNSVPQLDKVVMMERHLISPLFINSQLPTALFTSEDECISVMINEEDHLRVQAMVTGGDLMAAYQLANQLDSLLENKIPYAFDTQLGYLTSCPTNVGTGMRASYMIHVPALETTGQLQIILDAIGKFGLTVRGIYGENSDALGGMFQISNQVTLGLSEQEIMDNLTSVTKQIVQQELLVREKLLGDKRMDFEDAVFRSYGLLKYARVLTAKEAMTLLSDFKLGLELGIIKCQKELPMNIYELMMTIQPANLQKIERRVLNVDERDMVRAQFIRKNIPDIIGV